MSYAEDETEASRELALARIAELLGCTQDEVPHGFEQLLRIYGADCFVKGEQYAFDKDTLRLPVQPHQHDDQPARPERGQSGVYSTHAEPEVVPTIRPPRRR